MQEFSKLLLKGNHCFSGYSIRTKSTSWSGPGFASSSLSQMTGSVMVNLGLQCSQCVFGCPCPLLFTSAAGELCILICCACCCFKIFVILKSELGSRVLSFGLRSPT